MRTSSTHQFKTIARHTYDAGKQLYYHAWSANPEDVNSFWANKTEPHKGCSKEFWGRGMGWYFAALVDVLEVMPQSHPDYNELKTIVGAGTLARPGERRMVPIAAIRRLVRKPMRYRQLPGVLGIEHVYLRLSERHPPRHPARKL